MKEIQSSRVSLDADFFRRNNNLLVKRERQIRSVQVRGFHVLAFLVSLIAAAYVIQQTGRWIMAWDTLQIKHFRLTHAPEYDKEKIIRLLQEFRGNILSVDLEKIKRTLLQVSQIQEVTVSRVLPSTLSIDFVLRQPLYQWYSQKNWQILDEAGLVIRCQSDPEKGLIPIRNTPKEVLGKIFAHSRELKVLREKIEYADFRPPYGLEIKLLDQPEILYPGDSIISRLQRYQRLKKSLAGAENPLYADLRFPDRIYLGYNPSKEVAYEK